MATQSTSRLERFRTNRDSYFREHQNSPLVSEQKECFTALDYYPEDPALRFEVTLEEATLDLAPIEVGTGTDEAKTYTPAGWVEIPIEGEAVRFVVFREQGRGRYFLPFRDGTAGRETYGAGRYVDPQETPTRHADHRLQLRLQSVLRVRRSLLLRDAAVSESHHGPDPGRRARLRSLGIAISAPSPSI